VQIGGMDAAVIKLAAVLPDSDTGGDIDSFSFTL
jgi:hypothetical protein